MKEVQTKERMVHFSTPDSKTNLITVTRTHPDGTEEIIGHIYSDFSEGSDSLNYYSTTISGEELLPPTSDFIEIEREFEKSIKQIEQQSFEHSITEQMEEYEKRANEVQRLRNEKILRVPNILKR